MNTDAVAEIFTRMKGMYPVRWTLREEAIINALADHFARFAHEHHSACDRKSCLKDMFDRDNFIRIATGG